MTVLSRLVEMVRLAAAYNRHDLAAPGVVLWTDGERLWEGAMPLLLEAMPELLVLGGCDTSGRRGASTWVRYQMARRALEGTPVLYLPGLARHVFRGAAGFPEAARHLYALQFQGQFWTQANGKDWTPFAFLSSKDGGLGLDVARDHATLDALSEQLVHVLQSPMGQLEGRCLEAGDFHGLVTADPVRMLLQWMSDPRTQEKNWSAAQWKGFCAVCKERFKLDPHKDGRITAVERLVAAAGEWGQVWQRYCEAPATFPGIRKALDDVQPVEDLFDDRNQRIPSYSRHQEDRLRKGLEELANLPTGEARARLEKVSLEHAPRAAFVWTALGEAPLASAAVPLSEMVSAMKSFAPGADWAAMADAYLKAGWMVDAGARRAMAAARDAASTKAVSTALRAVYLPWLESLAEHAHKLADSYPGLDKALRPVLEPATGTVVVFVDGLRCDVGMELEGALRRLGCPAEWETSWSVLPTVTATAKAAWRPMMEHLRGDAPTENFEPQRTSDGGLLRTADFRALLAELGWTWIDPDGCGEPAGSGWTEVGAFDRLGHEQGAKLAWRIDEELRAVVDRVRDLLQAGWGKVIIVTDHGWLLCPGGLPVIQLPKHLTASKWGRCARALPGAAHGLPQTPWFWGPEHPVVLAPGIGAFRNGLEYAHGGLTLQEALVPRISVSAGPSIAAEKVAIESAQWVGMRLNVKLSGAFKDTRIDVRAKPADASSSHLTAAQRSKSADASGKISVVVENDDLQGHAAVVVVLKVDQLVAKRPTTIGEE